MNLKILYSEKFFIFLAAIIAVIFNLLPYIQQIKSASNEKVYIGSYPIIYDKPVYLSIINQGKEGNWKITDKYTSEPQKEVFIYPLYILMGHIARLFIFSTETIFFIGRLFFGIILLFTVICFIRYFISGKNQRKLAYYFALFSSGLGWITQNQESLDLWLPDAMPMVRFSYFPHFMLANIAFFLALLFFYRIFEEKRNKLWAILAGIFSFILNFTIPFSGILLYFLTASLIIILYFKNKNLIIKNLKNIFLFFILSAPSLIYLYYIGTQNEIWSAVEKQNILASPSPIYIITGYGLILIFSLYGLLALYQKDQIKGLFFSIWILSIPILAYIPLWIYPMQRRFLETGFYLPLAITASFGVEKIYRNLEQERFKNFNHKFAAILIIIAVYLMLSGNIQNWRQFNNFISNANMLQLYTSKENIEATKWLSKNSPLSSVILSSFLSGNIIPAYANRTVYIGHGPMTIDLEDKLKKVEDFYSEKYSPGEMLEFLKKENINYVFYSDEEKKLGNLNPENYDFLKEVYPLTQTATNTSSCLNNNILPNLTNKQISDCMGAGVYQNKTVKIYKLRNPLNM